MDAIWQTTFSSVFSGMKMFDFQLKFHWRFVPKDLINNIPALVQIMAWRRLGDKLLSEPIMVSLPTDICVARFQRVKVTSHERHGVTNHRYFGGFFYLFLLLSFLFRQRVELPIEKQRRLYLYSSATVYWHEGFTSFYIIAFIDYHIIRGAWPSLWTNLFYLHSKIICLL